MVELPTAPVVRIIRKSGATRVSGDAAKALAGIMEEYAGMVAREAMKLATHAGRKTVTKEDITMAAEILK